jgi:hypothetical protein
MQRIIVRSQIQNERSAGVLLKVAMVACVEPTMSDNEIRYPFRNNHPFFSSVAGDST